MNSDELYYISTICNDLKRGITLFSITSSHERGNIFKSFVNNDIIYIDSFYYFNDGSDALTVKLTLRGMWLFYGGTHKYFVHSNIQDIIKNNYNTNLPDSLLRPVKSSKKSI